MPAQATWPPPPSTPDPLAAHDGFLTACVLNSSGKRPVSRLSLMRDLRKDQGVDWRHSRAIVNDYCDRHAILPHPRGLIAWVVSLLLLAYAALGFMCVSILQSLRRSHDPATTLAIRVALESETNNVAYVSMSVAAAVGFVLLITILHNTKRLRRNAEDARKKLAG